MKFSVYSDNFSYKKTSIVIFETSILFFVTYFRTLILSNILDTLSVVQNLLKMPTKNIKNSQVLKKIQSFYFRLKVTFFYPSWCLLRLFLFKGKGGFFFLETWSFLYLYDAFRNRSFGFNKYFLRKVLYKYV